MSTNIEHLSYSELNDFLKSRKNRGLSTLNRSVIKEHIDVCQICWAIWNRARWDNAEGTKGYQELEEFLGTAFLKYFDSSWALAAEWFEEERSDVDQIARFYKNTSYYVYNSLIHYESGDRDDVSGEILRLINDFDIKSVIDYGCGIGTDGLFFLENNLFVHFFDFSNFSMDFLKWRLKKRKEQKFSLNSVEDLVHLPEADMLWAYDVFEHMKDPGKVIDMISSKTRLVVHESNHDDEAGGRHPFHFDFDGESFELKLRKLGFKKQSNFHDTLEVFYRE